MIRLSNIASMVLVVLGFGQQAVAQGFVSNCTWKTARMSGSFLGMYCHNDNWAHFSYGWTWFNTAYCLINNGGYLAPYN
ncbi:hypothetical protein SLS62_000139 [Diatrype stigma]|uniref:Uncharacterized protein n=1 Tax=Diatrype stigma TaxID=117547 RepID=A0AAN9YUS4_9PEZI